MSFTKIAEKLTPEELVKEIDTYFREFDAIMARYGVEKIKTIGDAYMAAGGLSNDNTTAAFDVTNAAFDVLKIVEDLKNEREALKRPAFQIRVGINTGPVVAGVVGSTKFQYDIWGDTVNTASRIESNGEVKELNFDPNNWLLFEMSTE